MRCIRVRGSAGGDAAVIGGIVPDPATLAVWAMSFPTRRERLRVFWARWGRGASGVGPERFLRHEPVDQARPPASVVPIRRPR
jgi:hypothetical protein